MGRYSPNNSYGHRIIRIEAGCYRLSWVNDRYYAGSRQRFPTTTHRDTDLEGAQRFAKKWGVAFEFTEKEKA